jgi:hypothetical protein
LTPGLGPRLAGKLLREFGSPEAIFEASLTSLEAQHLPAAVAQAIHSRQPLSAAAKEIAQAEQLGCKCSRGMNLSTRGYCAKSTIRHPSCMSAETLNFSPDIAFPSWERVVPPPTGIKWLSGWAVT